MVETGRKTPIRPSLLYLNRPGHIGKEVGDGGAQEALQDVGWRRMSIEHVVDGVLAFGLTRLGVSGVFDDDLVGEAIDERDCPNRDKLGLVDFLGAGWVQSGMEVILDIDTASSAKNPLKKKETTVQLSVLC